MPRKTSIISPIILFLLVTMNLFARPEYYGDRIMVYIENNITDFNISDDHSTTNLPSLNDVLEQENTIAISQWLPNARPTDKNQDIFLDRFYVLKFESSKSDLDRIIMRLGLLEEIGISEKVPIVEPAYVPNDSLWEELYGLAQIKADLAFDLWDIDAGELPGQMDSGEVVVAIPDIGLKWDHPDLIENIWQNLGEDLDGDGVVLELIDGDWVFDPDDENGIDDDNDGYVDNFVGYDAAMGDNDPIPLRLNHVHGTKVAGNISAMTNNEIGLASVGYTVKLMGVNANNNINEPWYLTHTNQAVLAAAQMGADIINCSWVSGYSTANDNFYQSIHNEYGSIIMGAAGNGVNNSGVSDTTDFNPRYPAGYDNVVSVTAMGADDSFNCWSNVHETVDISAPGEFIICAYTYSDTLYALGTGTSYATPLTAGAIALVKSVIPHADNETIISKVINTAEPYADMDRSCGGQSIEGLVGSGQLNIHRAVLACTYPELLPSEIHYQTDDGFINPGDTITIDVTITNSIGFEPADNVVAVLSTTDPNFSIISDQIMGDGVPLHGGEELTGQFVFTSGHDASLGDIPFNIHFSANVGEIAYENDVELMVPLSLGLYGFPIEDVDVRGVPIITDLDGNNLTEIYFGSDSMVHGKWMGGLDVNGFPFNAGAEVMTSISSGDLDGDGDKEIVFGTSDGVVHAVTKTGTEHMSYGQGDPIVDVPVLSDLDQDGSMEIIFIASNDSSSALYAIHDSGDNVTGFPVNFSERIVACPSVGDLDNNMVLDIVVVTQNGNVHVVEATGTYSTFMPLSTDDSFSTPATVVDLDGDQDLEMIMSDDNGDLHALHHDGSSMNSFETNAEINGGVSVADMDGNGSMELIFTGDDEHLHAWDPILDTEPMGWPIDLGSPGINEAITMDMDNDGDLEVICVSDFNIVHVYHHDGTSYENFPYVSQDSIYSTPAIGDLDNDGDFELIVGTLSDLRVIDIAQDLGDKYSWSTYRGNHHRDGYFDVTLASTSSNGIMMPTEYALDNNYPNPFNPITRLIYSLPKDSRVKITIHDINGRIVKTLMDDRQAAGKRSVIWNAKSDAGLPVATGLYFYRMESGNFQSTKKMILLK